MFLIQLVIVAIGLAVFITVTTASEVEVRCEKSTGCSLWLNWTNQTAVSEHCSEQGFGANCSLRADWDYFTSREKVLHIVAVLYSTSN